MSDVRERVAWDIVETPLGAFAVAVTERGLARVLLKPEDADTRLRAWREATFGPGALVREAAPTAAAAEALLAYARGERARPRVALDLAGTAFQRDVWRALTAIPFGETRTYGEVAAAVGRPRGAQAVGQASGANPVPLLVPCHRVLAATGLGGFAGGLVLKRRLLVHEGRGGASLFA